MLLLLRSPNLKVTKASVLVTISYANRHLRVSKNVSCFRASLAGKHTAVGTTFQVVNVVVFNIVGKGVYSLWFSTRGSKAGTN
jgi:hypothetical protein